MFFTLKLKRMLLVLGLCALVIAGALLAARCGNEATDTASECAGHVLVIDPGHGGIDGGATAADGTRESGINLAIGQKMRCIARLYGIDAVMTRETEESGVSADEYSERAELLRRAEIANKTANSVLISVHQNKFPTNQPTGAQVMYAASAGSRDLGLLAQEALVSFADPANRRVASPAPEALLLTGSVSCPAILAECGFMSNPSECAKLSTPGYQTKLACALTCAYMQFDSTDKTA